MREKGVARKVEPEKTFCSSVELDDSTRISLRFTVHFKVRRKNLNPIEFFDLHTRKQIF